MIEGYIIFGLGLIIFISYVRAAYKVAKIMTEQQEEEEQK